MLQLRTSDWFGHNKLHWYVKCSKFLLHISPFCCFIYIKFQCDVETMDDGKCIKSTFIWICETMGHWVKRYDMVWSLRVHWIYLYFINRV